MLMNLFDDLEPPTKVAAQPQPSASAATAAPLPVRRFQNIPWRQPDPDREEACAVCQAAAPCGLGNTWFCLNHAPEDYWPRR